jgi:hypothetical protein
VPWWQKSLGDSFVPWCLGGNKTLVIPLCLGALVAKSLSGADSRLKNNSFFYL